MPNLSSESVPPRIGGGARRPIPGVVLAAATIWIAVGSLAFMSGLFIALLFASVIVGAPIGPFGTGQPPAASREAATWGQFLLPLIALAIGAVFLFVGIQTLRGRAKDTSGNGKGSLLFGVFGLLSTFVMLPALGVTTLKGGALVALGHAVIALALLVAGVLALVGRTAYRECLEARRAS